MDSDDETSFDDGGATSTPGFSVRDESTASWVVDILLSYEDRIARHKAELAYVESRAEKARAFFLPMLSEWAAANPPRQGKTIHLYSGKIETRTVKGGPRIVDDAKALEWARDHRPDLVEVTQTWKLIKAAALGAIIDAHDGDLADAGVAIVDDEERVYVKASKLKGG